MALADLTDKVRRRIFRFYAVVLLIFLIMGGLFAFFYSDWKMRELLRDGDEFMEVGDRKAAYASFLKAYELRPKNRFVIRRLSTLVPDMDPEFGVKLLAHVLNKGDGYYTERVGYVRCLLTREKRDEAVGVELKNLLDFKPDDPEILFAAGKEAAVAGEREKAALFLGKAYVLNQSDPDVAYHWAMLLGTSKNLLNRVVSKSILMNICRGESFRIWDAARFLVSNRGMLLFPSDERLVYGRLLDDPKFEEDSKTLLIEQFRILARRTVELLPEKAMFVYKHLVAHEESNYEDTLELIRLGIRFHKYREVEPFLEELSKSPPVGESGKELDLLRARFQLGSHAGFDEGLAVFSRYLAKDSSDEGVLSALELELQSEDLKIGRDKVLELIQMLLNHPRANIAQRLLAFDRRLKLEPEKRDEVIEGVVSAARAHPDRLITWLSNNGESGRILSLFTEEECRNSLVLFKGRFHALVAEERYEEADRLYASRMVELGEAEDALLLCVRFEGSGDKEKSGDYWNKAFELARSEGRLESLLHLARLAFNLKSFDNCLAAYDRLIWSSIRNLPFDDWMRYLTAAAEGKMYGKSLRIAKEAFDVFPQNPHTYNNFAYLRLLKGEKVRDIVMKMEKLVDRYPEDKNFAMTLALGYYQLGEFRRALNLIERTQPSVPADRAVYAVILASSGQKDLAHLVLETINPESLMEPEQKLIELLVE